MKSFGLAIVNFSRGGNNGQMEPWHIVVYIGSIALITFFIWRRIDKKHKKREANKKPPKQIHKYINRNDRRR